MQTIQKTDYWNASVVPNCHGNECIIGPSQEVKQ